MKVTAVNKHTGEIIELPVDTPEQIVSAWRVAQEYVKAAEALKDQLKKLVPEFVGPRGTSEPIGNYMFRVSHIQRMNYDKAVMREVLDEDTFDLWLVPDKPRIDEWLKENIKNNETITFPISTKLRETMIPVGNPYQVIKLEKLNLYT